VRDRIQRKDRNRQDSVPNSEPSQFYFPETNTEKSNNSSWLTEEIDDEKNYQRLMMALSPTKVEQTKSNAEQTKSNGEKEQAKADQQKHQPLTQEQQAALSDNLSQILGFFRPLGEFVAGSVYQWLYNNGEPARWLLRILVPEWNGLEEDVEKSLPKSPWFEAGRTLGDGAAVVQGIAEIVGGTGAQVGGGALCITGIGCLGGAPAIVAGVALQVHGGAVASEGLANIAEDLGIVFHSKNDSETGDSSGRQGGNNADGIPSHSSNRLGSPPQPEIEKIKKLYKPDSESEARAIWHILQQNSTKQAIAGENDIKRFFGISRKEKGVNMTDVLKIEKSGKLVPVEVKNMRAIHLSGQGNAAFNKFRTISERVNMSLIDHFEVICHPNSKLPPNIRVDKEGKVSEMISGVEPPQWEVVTFGGKPVYIKYGDLGEISQ
jgi:hypothetical protein